MKIYLNTKLYDIKKRINTLVNTKKNISYKNILISKQHIRLFYGNISENQFKNLYKKTKSFQGHRSQFLIELLERRLERILVKANFVKSIKQARQLILHKHVNINNVIMKFPGYQVKANDLINLNEIGRKISIASWIKNSGFYKNQFITNANFTLLVDYKRFSIIFNENYIFTTINISTKNQLLLPLNIKNSTKILPISLDLITRYYQLH